MAFYQTPGTDFHDLNLDWVLNQVKQLTIDWASTRADWQQLQANNTALWEVINAQWAEYKARIDNFFRDLDLQDEVDAKLEEMAADGSLLALISSTVSDSAADAAGDWLAEHVTTTEGTTQVDDSLSIEHAAADAKATGDAINAILPITADKTAFWRQVPHTNMINGYTLGYIKASDGSVISSSTIYHSDYIPVTPGATYFSKNISTTYFAGYTADKTFVADAMSLSNNVITIASTETIAYIRVSFNSANHAAAAFITDINIIPDPYRQELVPTESTRIVADNTISPSAMTSTKHNPYCNLIDLGKKYTDCYINSSTGKMSNGNGNSCSDFIELEPGITYYVTKCFEKYCAYYNANHEFISAIGSGNQMILNKKLDPPAGAKYLRVSWTTAYANVASVSTNSLTARNEPKYCAEPISGAYTDTPTNYGGTDASVFDKVICIGDSITYGFFNHDSGTTVPATQSAKYAWPSAFTKLSGVQTSNYGVSGITTPGWFTRFGSDDLSGFDCAIMMLGINDNADLGGFTADVATAYGNIIDKLQTDNPGIKIFICNIVRAQSYGTSEAAATYNQDLKDYVDTLADPDVVYLDMNTYGHIENSVAFNAGHLSALGYYQMAKDIYAYISWYISLNKDDFRFVQFIGTDGTYTP